MSQRSPALKSKRAEANRCRGISSIAKKNARLNTARIQIINQLEASRCLPGQRRRLELEPQQRLTPRERRQNSLWRQITSAPRPVPAVSEAARCRQLPTAAAASMSSTLAAPAVTGQPRARLDAPRLSPARHQRRDLGQTATLPLRSLTGSGCVRAAGDRRVRAMAPAAAAPPLSCRRRHKPPGMAASLMSVMSVSRTDARWCGETDKKHL